MFRLNFAGWSFETSGEMETIEVNNGYAVLTAGGYPSSTHYARLRHTRTVLLDKTFSIEADIELPTDFYEKQVGYIKLMGTDNYAAAIDKNAWRINLLLFSDHLPRLVVQHQRVEETTLWKGGERLPLGRHTYRMVVRASETDPLTQLYLDGAPLASTDSPNVPPTLQNSEKVILKQMVGIDGAANNDENSISIRVHSIRISEDSSSCVSALLNWIWRYMIDATTG